MTYLEVKNWRNYQHYKANKPAWVKWYREITNDLDWIAMPHAGKLLLPYVLLVAAETENRIPDDAALLSSRLHLKIRIVKEGMSSLRNSGFLHIVHEDASNAGCSIQNECLRREETETYKEETETEAMPPTLQSHGFPDKWAQWLDYRRGQRWSVRAPWQSRQLAMLAKHGPEIAAAALDASMDQGWQGVFPEKVSTKRCAPELATSGPVRIADSAGYYRCHCGFQAPRAEVYAHIKAKHSSTEKIA